MSADRLCACPSLDAESCVRIRYNLDVEAPVEDPCPCSCHDDDLPDDSGDDEFLAAVRS